MVSIYTVVLLVVRRSTFLARPVTIDELLRHHVCMLMHYIESCPDFWGVVNSRVFFMIEVPLYITYCLLHFP